ncbi:5-formyltetrahydrofolate cyclo-ligase [Photobacterium aquimaris]|uniref:5-formyltetrahydrofolate cyclo-ligase n=1 Tax=Photobacterium aquimaris TaxID=512643 RepID=UPI00076A0E7C|nr:5-formyltetrahydrofolate cyclo-ligase [Photobacterium aquimaris]OBU24472.1 5-formyltetrahydrofolate cyclo-ligase [Photobacterium aquimaris]PQJ41935.1 5-formyltetrahydrofolate cyclo-ligase [Photobacterium aquimaris]
MTISLSVTSQQLRSQLRQQIRHARQQLSPQQQHHAAQQLSLRLQTLDRIQHSQHIAVYIANDGEIDPQPFIKWLWQQGKSVYLPVLHPFTKGHLLFLHYDTDTPMITNRYGISEPKLDIRRVKPVAQLDVICTPLVAFDGLGQRLGMGGGYYDRTLSQWHLHRRGPYPIGIGHDCQYIAQLPNQHWDVPLPLIITPNYQFTES